MDPGEPTDAAKPTNYVMAYDWSLTRRLKKEPELLRGNKDIKLKEERGIIPVLPSNKLKTSNTTHCRPYHPIIKTSSVMTKRRIVYKSAFKYDRKSVFNRCLLRGPLILPNYTHKTVAASDVRLPIEKFRPSDLHLRPDLRPNAFLLNNSAPTSDLPERREVNPSFGDTGEHPVALWLHRCRTFERLWGYWYEEYLFSLHERSKPFHHSGRNDSKSHPFLNQIVLLTDTDVPRGKWKLARVIRLIPSKDGHVRSAEIKLWNGVRLRRATNHLIPLEVEDSLDQTATETAVADETTELPLPQEPDPSPDSADILRTMDPLNRFPSSDQFDQ
jgi:hypothetical protein